MSSSSSQYGELTGFYRLTEVFTLNKNYKFSYKEVLKCRRLHILCLDFVPPLKFQPSLSPVWYKEVLKCRRLHLLCLDFVPR